MNIFIVYAHQEPKSFNGALKEQAVSILTGRGHPVIISDLYAMNFKAVADRGDFLTSYNTQYFKYGVEQRYAYETGCLASDIVGEQKKLKWADVVLFIFPFWWHSAPAILKGWFDRVLTPGFAYGKSHIYDTGLLKGKIAMLALTTGAEREKYKNDGQLGSIEHHLMPIQHGTLQYVGMRVLPPFIAWEPAHVHQKQREDYLIAFKERLLEFESIL